MNEAREERAHSCISHDFLSCMGWDMNIVPEGPPGSNNHPHLYQMIYTGMHSKG